MKWLVLFALFPTCFDPPQIEKAEPHITNVYWRADSVYYTGAGIMAYPGIDGASGLSFYMEKGNDTIEYNNGYPNVFYYKLSYWDGVLPDTLFVNPLPFEYYEDASTVLPYYDLDFDYLKIVYIGFGESDTFYMSYGF